MIVFLNVNLLKAESFSVTERGLGSELQILPVLKRHNNVQANNGKASVFQIPRMVSILEQ